MSAQPDGSLMEDRNTMAMEIKMSLLKAPKSLGLKENGKAGGIAVIVIWVFPERELSENTEHAERGGRLCYSSNILSQINWNQDFSYGTAGRAPVKQMSWSPGQS